MSQDGFVLDASVVAKLFLPEEGSDIVSSFLYSMFSQSDIELYVPDRFYLECASVLIKRVRAGELSMQTVVDDMNDILALDLSVIPSRELTAEALVLAVSYQLSVYDACYAALSVKLGFPLITADERLVRALKGTDIQAISVNHFSWDSIGSRLKSI